ncbi:tetratricopeptide repeat protein [Actinoplanes solisilvae]|uniref:tetratricopeptide repeat protein n=1 Tax=Actinoplanes solisilvae TaxID=2486853 RepID=UPI000FDA4BE3|nr:tetratricopeptide repeat protein [Actinoplanes solisilvae]
MTDTFSVLQRAQALLATGRAEQALTELSTLTANEVTSPYAMQLRCAALSRLDRWAEVGDAARAGLAASGPDPDLLLWLGRAEHEAGRDEAAERVLLDGLALAPHDVDLLCAYADLCLAHGQLDKAAKLVELAAARAPQAPVVYATRIQIAHARGDHREAQRISREFVGVHPENPAAHALLGGTSAARGQVDAAYEGFRQAAAARPTERAFAESAMELRVARHPLMLPLRPILRFGAIKTWLVAVALILLLRTAGLPVLAGLLGFAWLAYCVYSWVVPPLVRRWVLRMWR